MHTISSFFSPEEARKKFVAELDLARFDPETQDRLISTAIEATMKEVAVAIFSYVPEKECARFDKMAEMGQHEVAQAIITKYVEPQKIAEIIEGVWEQGFKNYKQLLADKR